MRFFERSREYACPQPKIRGIRPVDRSVKVWHFYDGHNRAKALLMQDIHVACAVGQDGWFIKPAGVVFPCSVTRCARNRACCQLSAWII